MLVWGSITDVAQALHDDPSIKEKIRVHYIASWNRTQDPYSFKYVDENHPDTWLIRDETTFRGWYIGGRTDGDRGSDSEFWGAGVKYKWMKKLDWGFTFIWSDRLSKDSSYKLIQVDLISKF